MPKKKSYSATFEFSAVLDALRSDAADAEVARRHGVHPVTLSGWRRHVIERGHESFASQESERAYERKIGQLERMLGQKEVELARSRSPAKAP